MATPDDTAAGQRAADEHAASAAGDLPAGVGGAAATERALVRGTPLRWIMLAIFGWGVVLSVGVVWYDYRAGHVQWLKPLIILLMVAGFLACWQVAVRRRSEREKNLAADFLKSGKLS